MEATRLLESQHRRAETIIQDLQAGIGDREQLTHELADMLAAHMTIEEEIFYPAARAVRGNTILKSYEEHDTEVPVVERLLASTHDEDAFQARLAVLSDLLQQHVSEEENDLFPEMDRTFGRQQIEALGEQMDKRFREALPMGHHALMAMRAHPMIMPGMDRRSQQAPEGRRRPRRQAAQQDQPAKPKAQGARRAKAQSKRTS